MQQQKIPTIVIWFLESLYEKKGELGISGSISLSPSWKMWQRGDVVLVSYQMGMKTGCFKHIYIPFQQSGTFSIYKNLLVLLKDPTLDNNNVKEQERVFLFESCIGTFIVEFCSSCSVLYLRMDYDLAFCHRWLLQWVDGRVCGCGALLKASITIWCVSICESFVEIHSHNDGMRANTSH